MHASQTPRADVPVQNALRPIRAGVIGTGGITAAHFAYLSASQRACIAGVTDLSAASARHAAERWGAEQWFTSHEQMLAQADLDVVHVCTPPMTHTAIVADCLRAGVHVICEKPLAPHEAALRDLHELAERQGVWLLEDQNYRWNDPLLQAQRTVKSGAIGTVRDVDVRMALDFRSGGAFSDPHLRNSAHDLPAGPVHDVLTHLAYAGLMFLPQMHEPERVSVHWSNHGADDGLWRWDDLDATLIASGAHLRLRFSSATRPEAFAIVVRGDAGEVATDLFQPFFQVRRPRRVGKQLSPITDHLVNGAALAAAGLRNLTQRLLQHSTYHGLERFLDATYLALQDGGEPPLSYRDIADAARLIDLLLLEEHRR